MLKYVRAHILSVNFVSVFRHNVPVKMPAYLRVVRSLSHVSVCYFECGTGWGCCGFQQVCSSATGTTGTNGSGGGVKDELDNAVPPHALLDVSVTRSKAELATRGGLANRHLPTSAKKQALSNSSSVKHRPLNPSTYFFIIIFLLMTI